MDNTLVIVTGPTASGKTDLAINIAREIGCDIMSADSRQIYMGLPIGTAAPSAEQLAQVRHHFVGILPLDAYYSAAQYEEDVMKLLPEMWRKNNIAVMCGGSMMYIDAVTKGIDELPTISARVREEVKALYERGGNEALIEKLRLVDPKYLERADLNNSKRLIHAIEITLEAGAPCSSLLTGKSKTRDFNIVKIAIDYPREQLFDRINRRTDAMIAAGLEDEARSVYHLRHLNSLNTVGYKEMFAMMDGVMDRDTAIARIAKNTRVYAKKQLLWLSKDRSVIRLSPEGDLTAKALEAVYASISSR
ncbi:MAG: tRNA (adenosine(37)-N6)-dimethylallyltransferase MiaA [Duncaniella sp.]|nr:tRNA (adenosine(37)-N6)-dimethylallyltransferase MiaA [Duncaniella sp.]